MPRPRRGSSVGHAIARQRRGIDASPLWSPSQATAVSIRGARVLVWRGDIRTLRVGAIVNAANEGGLGCFRPDHVCVRAPRRDSHGKTIRVAAAAAARSHGKTIRVAAAAAARSHGKTIRVAAAAAARSHGKTIRVAAAAAARSHEKTIRVGRDPVRSRKRRARRREISRARRRETSPNTGRQPRPPRGGAAAPRRVRGRDGDAEKFALGGGPAHPHAGLPPAERRGPPRDGPARRDPGGNRTFRGAFERHGSQHRRGARRGYSEGSRTPPTIERKSSRDGRGPAVFAGRIAAPPRGATWMFRGQPNADEDRLPPTIERKSSPDGVVVFAGRIAAPPRSATWIFRGRPNAADDREEALTGWEWAQSRTKRRGVGVVPNVLSTNRPDPDLSC